MAQTGTAVGPPVLVGAGSDLYLGPTCPAGNSVLLLPGWGCCLSGAVCRCIAACRHVVWNNNGLLK